MKTKWYTTSSRRCISWGCASKCSLAVFGLFFKCFPSLRAAILIILLLFALLGFNVLFVFYDSCSVTSNDDIGSFLVTWFILIFLLCIFWLRGTLLFNLNSRWLIDFCINSCSLDSCGSLLLLSCLGWLLFLFIEEVS